MADAVQCGEVDLLVVGTHGSGLDAEVGYDGDDAVADIGGAAVGGHWGNSWFNATGLQLHHSLAA